eukprot:scaffold50240_cov17-Tisochrysis_lutea.AAC.1
MAPSPTAPSVCWEPPPPVTLDWTVDLFWVVLAGRRPAYHILNSSACITSVATRGIKSLRPFFIQKEKMTLASSYQIVRRSNS